MSVKKKKRFDSDYSTQYVREYKYLLSYGFKPSYVYFNNDTKIITYKYLKSPELFIACANFYNDIRNEVAYNNMKAAMDSADEVYTFNTFNDLYNFVSELTDNSSNLLKNVLPCGDESYDSE